MPIPTEGSVPSRLAAILTAEQLGGSKTIGRRVQSDADMASAVERGFPVATIDALRKSGVTDQEIGDLVIKPRTLSHRRAKRSLLTPEESDRAVKIARIRALADETFADRTKADRWLHKELSALDGRRPMELIRTHAGARIVEDLLAKIAWGAAA
jgi:putative toxin-antitoxin system antitoxin component (TIGR02293 family)